MLQVHQGVRNPFCRRALTHPAAAA